jgi:hypothetical protein
MHLNGIFFQKLCVDYEELLQQQFLRPFEINNFNEFLKKKSMERQH